MALPDWQCKGLCYIKLPTASGSVSEEANRRRSGGEEENHSAPGLTREPSSDKSAQPPTPQGPLPQWGVTRALFSTRAPPGPWAPGTAATWIGWPQLLLPVALFKVSQRSPSDKPEPILVYLENLPFFPKGAQPLRRNKSARDVGYTLCGW